ncbi:unnamed protein product, partial [Urochloa humidicola]
IEPPPLPRTDRREQSVAGEEEEGEEMSGLEQELGLSLGVLIDVVDEQWMRDTLPADEIPVPPAMAVKTEENEDPAPANQESQPAQGDVWRDFALENL